MILEGERRPSHGIGNPFVHGTKVYRVFISAKSNPHDAVLSGHGAVLNGHDAEKYWGWTRVLGCFRVKLLSRKNFSDL